MYNKCHFELNILGKFYISATEIVVFTKLIAIITIQSNLKGLTTQLKPHRCDHSLSLFEVSTRAGLLYSHRYSVLVHNINCLLNILSKFSHTHYYFIIIIQPLFKIAPFCFRSVSFFHLIPTPLILIKNTKFSRF